MVVTSTIVLSKRSVCRYITAKDTHTRIHVRIVVDVLTILNVNTLVHFVWVNDVAHVASTMSNDMNHYIYLWTDPWYNLEYAHNDITYSESPGRLHTEINVQHMCILKTRVYMMVEPHSYPHVVSACRYGVTTPLQRGMYRVHESCLRAVCEHTYMRVR